MAQLDRIKANYRKEMTALIGEEKIQQCLTQHKKLLGELERPKLFDLSPEGLEKEEESRKRIITKRHALYRSMGFDHEKAIALRRKYLKEASTVTDQYLKHRRKLEYVSRCRDDVVDTDQPFTYYYPHYYKEWGDSFSSSRPSKNYGCHAESRFTGAVSCRNYGKLKGTDD